MYCKLTPAISLLLLSACQTIPTVDDVSQATSSAIDDAVKIYNDTNISEKLASDNIKQTAQDILDVTQLSNFLQLPGKSRDDEIRKKGYLVVAAMGVWDNTQRGIDNETYPGETVIYDERIEKIVQSRIASLKDGETISWRQTYWGALWVNEVVRYYDNQGRKCLNFKIKTPHRYGALLGAGWGVAACLNEATGIYGPQEIRHRDILPPTSLAEFGPFTIPGERIDTWNLKR